MNFKNKEIKELESKLLYLLDVSQELKDKVCDLCASGNNREVDNNSLSNNSEQIYDLENQIEEYKSVIRETNADMLKLKAINDNLSNENTDLKCKIKDKENELSAVESNLSEVLDKNDSLEKENREVESKLAQLKNKYEAPENLLKKYRTLPNTIRLGLSDVICDKNEILFITSCTSPEHLKAIWVYTKKLVATDRNADEVEVLKEIFDYFFDVYNDSLSEPVYVRDSVEDGCTFDDDKYDRFPGSATSGKITKIIIRGYKSANTGNIICRSLVRL